MQCFIIKQGIFSCVDKLEQNKPKKRKSVCYQMEDHCPSLEAKMSRKNGITRKKEIAFRGWGKHYLENVIS